MSDKQKPAAPTRTVQHKSSRQKTAKPETDSVLRCASIFSRIIPRSFKIKHLALLPVLALLQVLVYFVYIQKTERVLKERADFINSQLNPDSAKRRGDYRVLYKFQKSDTYSQVQEDDVTVITQCSVNNLHYLIDMAGRWQGQISVSVFAPKNDAITGLYAINAIRRCFPSVRELVTFHLVWPDNKSPVYENNPPKGLTSPDCSIVYTALKAIPGQNYAHTSIPYPHNTLRNAARENLNTKLIFLLDVDTVPSKTAREQFLQFVHKRDVFGEESDIQENTVFVTPAWEVLEEVEAPEDKQDLLNLLEAERIRPFHNETCWHCHKTTRYNDWIEVAIESQLSIAYEVDWEQSWEPYYFSLNSAPLHDERFKQYGYDRISQICELYMAGYRFFVLNNVFTVHQGYKRLEGFHMEKNIENRRNFLLFEDYFQPEMQKKYPEANRTCRQQDAWSSRDGRAKVRSSLEELMKQQQKRNVKK